MVGVGAVERLLERSAHVIGGMLDQLWALPAAARLNRAPLASIAVLALAGLAYAVAAGGLGVPQAARAVPVVGEPEPQAGPSSQPSASTPAGPFESPGFTFQPIDPGSSAPRGGVESPSASAR
jgi:hypothetical protein